MNWCRTYIPPKLSRSSRIRPNLVKIKHHMLTKHSIGDNAPNRLLNIQIKLQLLITWQNCGHSDIFLLFQAGFPKAGELLYNCLSFSSGVGQPGFWQGAYVAFSSHSLPVHGLWRGKKKSVKNKKHQADHKMLDKLASAELGQLSD